MPNQKKASLWEKTIVRAFRDLQWHYKGSEHSYPEPSAEFDGKLEQALGDGIVAASDKLYLLEMKADESGKQDEWNSKPGKLPYQSLKKSLSSGGDSDQRDTRSMHVMSMRGHLFLYWEPLPALKRSICRPGALVVSSYLLDAAAASPAQSEDRSKDLIVNFSLGQEVTERHFTPMDQLLAARLFTTSMRLLEVGSNAQPMPLGLSTIEMQNYVTWLIGHQVEKNLPINALLVSRSGSLCQHVTTIDELMNIIERLQSDHDADAGIALSGVERRNPRLDEVKVEEPTAPRRTRARNSP